MIFSGKALRRSIAGILLAVMLLSPGFSSAAADTSASAEDGICGEETEKSELYEKLSRLEGVSSVEVIPQTDAVFAEKYLLTFTQPLDWDDPSAGSFEQRVELGFAGEDNVCCYQVRGYYLYDVLPGYEDILSTDDSSELVKEYDGNFINIEYRFFGKSIPQGLSSDSTEYWQYLTCENAAKDFRHIIDALSTVLTGKKVFSGGSKGGFTTNTMAYYYPDLCDAYVSYVAPLCDGTADPAFYRNIYETIGDLGYSADTAAEMRGKVLDFQVYCIENRAELQEMCVKSIEGAGLKYRDAVTPDVLFDVTVLEFAPGFRQYGYDFTDLDEVLALPDATDAEHAEKLQRVFELLTGVSPLDSYSTGCTEFAYYVQAEKEMGQYAFDFSYLRAAVIEKTGEDLLAVSEDMEEGLFEDLVFTEEQKEAFQYDPSLREALLAWSETTDAYVIMIYGGCDTWYAVRIPETENPDIHIFVGARCCHRMYISLLDEDDRSECLALLDARLK